MGARRYICYLSATVLGVMLTSCAGTPAGDTISSSTAVTQSDPRYVTIVDIETAENEQALVTSATVIVVGTPTGKVQEVPTSKDAEGILGVQTFSDYFQTVKVHQVLRGDLVSDTIQVVRGGTSSAAKAKGVVNPEGGDPGLGHGKQILFLQASAAPGVFQIVGHWSGVLRLDGRDRAKSDRPETKKFDGLTIAEVEQQITALAAVR